MDKKNNLFNINDNKNQSIINNEQKNDIEINDLEEEINIFNKKNKNLRSKESNSKIDEILTPNDINKYQNRKMRNRVNRRIKFTKEEDYEENNKNLSTIQSTKRNIINRNKIRPVKTSTISFQGLKANELEKMGRIRFKYNIFEIFWSFLCKCCMTNKLKAKQNLNEKANNILNSKLDITLYVKHALLIDILNQALINDNMKSMTKFISRPIISLSKSGERDVSQFYKNYEITDFDNLYEDVSELSKKPKMTQAEQKIISLVYNELKEMV
jgi:hypothetical protein